MLEADRAALGGLRALRNAGRIGRLSPATSVGPAILVAVGTYRKTIGRKIGII
jgi:hypothetical protein